MPNNFLDVSGRLDRIIKKSVDAPAQGVRMVAGDIAQKMVISPMKFWNLASGNLVGKPGISFLIHSVVYSIVIDADDMTTSLRLGVFGGMTTNLMSVAVLPATVATYNGSMVLDILTEPNSTITWAYATGAPTITPQIFVYYQEVYADEC